MQHLLWLVFFLAFAILSNGQNVSVSPDPIQAAIADQQQHQGERPTAVILAPNSLPVPVPVGPKRAGLIRVGLPLPILAGEDEVLSEPAAEQLRMLVSKYLFGPNLEAAPLKARLSSQIAAEAKAAECDYVLLVTAQKKSAPKKKGWGMVSQVGKLAGMAPGLGGVVARTAGTIGTIPASTAGSMQTGNSLAVEYQFQLTASNSAQVVSGIGQTVLGVAGKVLDEVTKRQTTGGRQ